MLIARTVTENSCARKCALETDFNRNKRKTERRGNADPQSLGPQIYLAGPRILLQLKQMTRGRKKLNKCLTMIWSENMKFWRCMKKYFLLFCRIWAQLCTCLPVLLEFRTTDPGHRFGAPPDLPPDMHPAGFGPPDLSYTPARPRISGNSAKTFT